MSKHTQDLIKLAELPGLIEAQDRIILGLKDDKLKNERRRKHVEARIQLSDEVKSEKNQKDRDASHLLLCEADPTWTKATDRLEELRRTIAKHEAQRDLLRREREALRVVLEHAFADRLEAALSDKELGRMIGSGFRA